MCQRVHAGGRSERRGQTERETGVEHGVIRNKRKVVDGVFVVRLSIGDDGGERCFAARACRGRRADEQQRAAHDMKQSAHLLNGLIRTGDTRAGDLGAVHGGAAADGDDRPRSAGQISLPCRFDVADGGVLRALLINGKVYAGMLQRVFKRRAQAQIAHAAIQNEKDGGDAFAFEHRDNLLQAA